MRKSLRFLMTAAVVVALCTLLWGDVSAQIQWELGVKAGLGLTKLTGDDTAQTEGGVIDLGGGYYGVGELIQDFGDSKTGFVGGVYATAQINDRFGIRLEGLYTQKGGKGKNSGELDVYDSTDTFMGTLTASGENTLTLDYFEVPVLAVFSFPISTTATFDIFAGPAFAFKSKAEVETEITMSFQGESETSTDKTDISDDIEGMDIGGVLGAGVSFDLDSVVLFGDARWTYGFKTIDSSEDAWDIKNSTFGFMVGVGIPLASSK